MSNGNTMSLAELDARIAFVRGNINALIEQAAAHSGAADEDRNAERLDQQQEELKTLLEQRDELPKNAT